MIRSIPFRKDSVELVSDDELFEFEPASRMAAKLNFGRSSNVSNTLADVTGVRYLFRDAFKVRRKNISIF